MNNLIVKIIFIYISNLRIVWIFEEDDIRFDETLILIRLKLQIILTNNNVIIKIKTLIFDQESQNIDFGKFEVKITFLTL